MRVHFRLLTELDVFCLRLGNLDFGLQFPGLRDARQLETGDHLFPDVHLQQLHHAVNPRADVQGVHLALLELKEPAQLVNFRLLRRKLSLGVFRVDP